MSKFIMSKAFKIAAVSAAVPLAMLAIKYLPVTYSIPLAIVTALLLGFLLLVKVVRFVFLMLVVLVGFVTLLFFILF